MGFLELVVRVLTNNISKSNPDIPNRSTLLPVVPNAAKTAERGTIFQRSGARFTDTSGAHSSFCTVAHNDLNLAKEHFNAIFPPFFDIPVNQVMCNIIAIVCKYS